jgi:NAD(P)-dependent dehydrogenase (short-subunit alcohol dehydrogenase family)
MANAFAVEVRYSAADMAKPDEIAAMVAEAEREFGAVDILCNNAGIQHVAPIEQFPIDKWNAILAINLSAAFHAIRAALPRMKKKGWGRIINTASAHALVASPYKVAYVAAKHGLGGLTKVVALETAEAGITVNAICPVCLDAAGREADPRHGQGARHDRGAGDARRDPRRPADQGIRHRRGGGGARRVPYRTEEHHGALCRGWRLDGGGGSFACFSR